MLDQTVETNDFQLDQCNELEVKRSHSSFEISKD